MCMRVCVGAHTCARVHVRVCMYACARARVRTAQVGALVARRGHEHLAHVHDAPYLPVDVNPAVPLRAVIGAILRAGSV